MPTFSTLSLRTRCQIVLPVLLILIAGCRRQVSPAAEAVEQGRAPDQEAWDTHYFISEAGTPRVEILAPYMAKFTGSDSMYTLMRSRKDGKPGKPPVTARIMDETGSLTATLSAQEIVYFENEGRYDARGAVRIVTPEGRRLEGRHIRWEQSYRRLSTVGFVRITTKRERLQGFNLTADEDLKNYAIGRVTGIVTLEEGQ